jgi:hypothetical protein
MAVSAAFTADFTQFVAATKSAEASLATLEGQSARVGSTFDKTQGNADRFHDSLQRFDGVLAAVGLNIGAEVRALGELGQAAGKTAGELGLITTAGLTAGAALGGWKLGRLIAEFFELDKVIGNATAKLLGWGDLTGETAGAKQDVVTRAIERGASATITYAEALEFNTAWQKKRAVATKEAAKADEDIARAMIELNSAGVGWQGTLETINGTVVEAIKFYLAAGVSQSDLATANGLTAVQVKAVAAAMTDEAAATVNAQAAEKTLAEFRQIAHLQQIDILKAQATEQLRLAGIVNDAVTAELAASIQLNAAHGLDAMGRQKVTSAAETLRLGLEELHRVKVDGIAQTAQEQILIEAYTKALYDEAVAQDKANFGLAQVPPIAAATSAAINGVTASYWAAVDAAAALAGIPSIGHRPGEPGTGIHENPHGPPILTGPGIGGGGLHPLQGLHPVQGAPSLGMVNNYYVNGTAGDVARQISDKVMRTVLQSSKVVPR